MPGLPGFGIRAIVGKNVRRKVGMMRRSSLRHFVRPVFLAACAAVVLLFGGCQAIFTYSPLSGLQQSPSDMTPAQRLTYAQDALASGDTAAMKSAYDAIKNDTSAEAQYTTAQLGIELSGVSAVLRDIATDTSTLTTQLNTIDDFITSHHLDPTYMVAAAAQLTAAAAGGVTLSTMDYAMGSMGLLLGDAMAESGTWNITPAIITDPERDAASSFLAPAVANVATLPSGDPLKQFITDLDNFISGL
jgi:hypothetical protein